jgi:DNA-binding Lrp family transcriptional regulator
MPASVELTTVDLEILRLLQNDSRRTNRSLAEAVGVAPSTCLDRVSRLKRTGVIQAFTLRVDHRAVGRAVEAFLAIRVQPHRRPLVVPLVDHLLGLPATRAVYHVTGANDYLVHVAASDVADLQRLVLDDLTARSEVALVQTTLIFQRWEGGPILPPG